MDKLSSNALKNKPLFKEWLVRIKKANLLKLGQYQICLEHFEKDVYKTWTGVHGPPHEPGPWTTMDHPMDLVHGPPHGPGPIDHP